MSDRIEERRRLHFANLQRGSGFITKEIEESKKGGVAVESTIKVQKNISRDVPDYLYHFGLNNTTDDLVSMFGDVKFVCMGGSAVRMESFAHSLMERFGIKLPPGTQLAPIGKTERYSMFKVGPIISVSHGMGMPSISILLHEITKLLYHARATDVTYIRLGTSGGVGIEPGTVIVTTEGLNDEMEPWFKQTVLGKVVKRPTHVDPELPTLAHKLAQGSDSQPSIPCVLGKTYGTDDFYEGQARLDGALCEYTLEDQRVFLTELYNRGVRNIEMESPCMASFCGRLNIPCLIVCCALLNRLNGDQVNSTPEQLKLYSLNAQEVVLRFLEHKLLLETK